MDVLRCGSFPGKVFSGTVSFASFIDGLVCTTGHMTHAVVLLCSALLGWCSLRPFCSLEWHVVDGCARSDGAPTKSTCISSVLGHALSLEGQLVIMLLVVDEGQQPHVRVLAWCFSGSPVACQPWHLQNAVCLFTELLGRCAVPSIGDLPPMPVLSREDGSQAGIPLTSVVILLELQLASPVQLDTLIEMNCSLAPRAFSWISSEVLLTAPFLNGEGCT